MRPIMTLEIFSTRRLLSARRLATLVALTTFASASVAAQAPTSKPGAAAARAAESPRSPIVERTEGSGPNGATMRCKDGSYPPNGAPDSACDGKGGILVRFPLRRFPQASTAPKLVAAPSAPRAPVDTATANALLREPPMVNRAKEFRPAERPPANAALQCNDGSYVVSDTTSARCATRGGVMTRFAPVRRPPR
jgi:hypothetical protein